MRLLHYFMILKKLHETSKNRRNIFILGTRNFTKRTAVLRVCWHFFWDIFQCFAETKGSHFQWLDVSHSVYFWKTQFKDSDRSIRLKNHGFSSFDSSFLCSQGLRLMLESTSPSSILLKFFDLYVFLLPFYEIWHDMTWLVPFCVYFGISEFSLCRKRSLFIYSFVFFLLLNVYLCLLLFWMRVRDIWVFVPDVGDHK